MTLTGVILRLLGTSPVVVHRAATDSVSSGAWENFILLHSGRGGKGTCDRLGATGAGQSSYVSSQQWHSSPAWAEPRCSLAGPAQGTKYQLGGGLCGKGLKAALPEFMLPGRYTLTELSFYLQTEQLYWQRFSKHGTAQCYVY